MQTVKSLKDFVDIWLPDFKYFDNRLGIRYSQAGDYFETASEAILQMIEQTGSPVWKAEQTISSPYRSSSAALPLLESGVIIRHLVLPSHKDDSIALLHWLKKHLPEGQYLLSLMSQYPPSG